VQIASLRNVRNDKEKRGNIYCNTHSEELHSCIMMLKNFYVYILTNPSNTVLYTGITNDIVRRTYEHKGKEVKGFTSRYNVIKLVYYETYEDADSAIAREKQIKAGSRAKKIELIEKMNPKWKDLSKEWE
jgi:putative endonuclease